MYRASKAAKYPETRGLIVLVPDRVRVGTDTGRGGREQVAEAPEVGNGELLPEVVGEPRGGPRLGRVGITPQPVRAFFLQILEEPSRTRAKGTTVLDSEGDEGMGTELPKRGVLLGLGTDCRNERGGGGLATISWIRLCPGVR